MSESTGNQPVPVDPLSSLGSYLQADAATRKLIETTLRRQHRQAMQPYYLQWGGIVSGFAISVICVAEGVGLVNGGHAWVGGLLSIGEVATLAGVFVGRRWTGRPK